MPIYDDLNQDEAINLFDLNKSLLDEANVVPLRLREGDDASCLNLNKAIRPKIFGIKPSDFDGRFEFAEGNWSSLYQNPDGGAIPALVDQNTLMWALKMGMGGRLNYVDGEGKPFEVEVVGAFKGSMLQGALFIKEDGFFEINSNSRVDTVVLCLRVTKRMLKSWQFIWRTDYFSMGWSFGILWKSLLNYRK